MAEAIGNPSEVVQEEKNELGTKTKSEKTKEVAAEIKKHKQSHSSVEVKTTKVSKGAASSSSGQRSSNKNNDKAKESSRGNDEEVVVNRNRKSARRERLSSADSHKSTKNKTTKPSRAVTKPSSVVTKPSSADTKPSRAVTKPSSVVAKRSSAVIKPSSVVAKPSSVVAKPSSADTKHSSASTKHSSAITKPSSADTKHSSAATKPSSAATKPSSAATKPSSAATKFSSAVTKPSSIDTKPCPKPSSAAGEEKKNNHHGKVSAKVQPRLSQHQISGNKTSTQEDEPSTSAAGVKNGSHTGEPEKRRDTADVKKQRKRGMKDKTPQAKKQSNATKKIGKGCVPKAKAATEMEYVSYKVAKSEEIKTQEKFKQIEILGGNKSIVSVKSKDKYSSSSDTTNSAKDGINNRSGSTRQSNAISEITKTDDVAQEGQSGHQMCTETAKDESQTKSYQEKAEKKTKFKDGVTQEGQPTSSQLCAETTRDDSQAKNNQEKAGKKTKFKDCQRENITKTGDSKEPKTSKEEKKRKHTSDVAQGKTVQNQKKKDYLSNHSAMLELMERPIPEILNILNSNIHRLRTRLNVKKESCMENELIFDVTRLLGKVCLATPTEKLGKILETVKTSSFLTLHAKRFLQKIVANDVVISDRRLYQLLSDLLGIFSAFLCYFPTSCSELDDPLEVLLEVLKMANAEQRDKLERGLVALLEKRNEIKEAKRRRNRYPFNQISNQNQEPPDDYRQIQICPTLAEITTTEKPFLRSNIKHGRYERPDHYLDVQFRLFREDFVAPLREGIQEITTDTPLEKRNHNVKLYHDVQILSKKYTKSGITYTMKFDVSRFRQTNWDASRRLIFGSFLCLSTDNFKSMLFATVANREPKELKKGRVEIKFVEGQSVTAIETRNEKFTAAESPAFFESYRHVLVGLQVLNENNLPFQKYLVECRSDVDAPAYLRCNENRNPILYRIDKSLGMSTAKEDADLNVSSLSKRKPRRMKAQKQQIEIPVLQTDAWPTIDKIPLNQSQLDALKTALTTEFSVIQGPPGTGKTFIGLKIVETLLDNKKYWSSNNSSPMLMVCYTNHALDQFLEGVLEFLPKGIIRVGGRSKSEKLEEFNLKKSVRYGECSPIYKTMKKQSAIILDHKRRAEWQSSVLLKFDEIEPFISEDFSDSLYFCKPNSYSGSMTKLFNVWLCSKEDDLQPVDTLYDNEDDDEDEDEDEDDDSETEEEKEEQQKTNSGADYNNDDELKHKQKSDKKEEKRKKRKNDEMRYDVATVRAIEAERNIISTPPTTRYAESQTAYLQSRWTEDSEETFVSCGFESVAQPEETIDVEQEADRLQQERCLEGEEDAFLPIRVHEEFMLSQIENDKEQQAEPSDNDEPEQSAPQALKRPRLNVKVTKSDRSKVQDLIRQGVSALTEEEVAEIQNVWKLSELDRIRIYLFWLACYKQHWQQEMEKEEENYQCLVRQLEDARANVEMRTLKRATVIGMTTTGASRYHEILQEIRPKIVVIEEAAEVLEAHILTSLTKDTQHTILIGDHKQLRPKPQVYELAQNYNLEISLFERMVLNKMDCKQLSTQHRMRPSIARLTKRIYESEIFDHESVHHFENVRGIEKNLFFVNHRKPEKQVPGLLSYSNQHEGTFVVSLTRYLLYQGYDKTKITVLTMYSGQLLELKGKMPKKEFEGLQVTVVDNFQGEENDIIILSLVRSSEKGPIGFLKEENRICVALSRARKGFYCIGNFDLLSRKSTTWRDIVEDLKTEDEIGEELRLKCSKHGNIIEVNQGEDFKKTPLGGCGKACGEILNCGHTCRLLCHGFDTNHVEYVCEEKCPNRCPQDHHCFSPRCHYGSPCPPCMVNAIKQCLKCGANVQSTCGCPLEKLECMRPCQETLSCNHKCERYCFECFVGCDQTKCQIMVAKSLSCNHLKEMHCGENPDNVDCQVRCRQLLQCGHQCPGKCYQDCTQQKCSENVLSSLDCGHEVQVKCCEKNLTTVCRQPCEEKLSCNHKCPGMCYEDCSQFLCQIQIEVELRCGHMQPRVCHESGSDQKCYVPVEVIVPGCQHKVEIECWKKGYQLTCPMPCSIIKGCSHRCQGKCGVPCEGTPCSESKEKLLPCGHYKNIPCFMAVDDAVCDTLKTIELPGCKHTKTLPCCEATKALSGDVIASCNVVITKTLPCTHTVELPCFQTIDEVSCKKPCERLLSCGIHRCQNICGMDCSQTKCNIKVWKELLCPEKHRVFVPCHLPVEEITCAEKCRRKLECGHPCTQMCGTSCSDYQCQVVLSRTLSCPKKHVVNLPCYKNPDTYVCQARCTRQMECGHPCQVPCGLTCDISRCRFRTKKLLPCGHERRIPCNILPTDWRCRWRMWKLLPCNHREQTLCNKAPASVFCRNTCGADLSCGHKCSGMCGRCKRRGTHDVCKSQCTRTLVCSHPCPAVCSEPCPPCNKRCERACPHTRCQKRCGEICDPCKKPCENICPHSRCSRSCYELCDKMPCDEACTERLHCGHHCSGLCGEVCPKFCKDCTARSAERSSTKNSSDKTFIQLFDCGHVVDVLEMDQLMELVSLPSRQHEMASPLQTKTCPKCSTPIRFSYRYERIVKQSNSVVEKIKYNTSKMISETEKDILLILKNNPHCREKVYMMQFPVAITFSGSQDKTAIIKATSRARSFFPVLRNHFLVLRLVFQALDLIEPNIKRNQMGENDDTSILMPCYFLLFNYLKEVETKLMFPILQEETIRSVEDDALKLTLLCHVLLAKEQSLQNLKELQQVGEFFFNRILDQARKPTFGVKRTGMYHFLKSLNLDLLREAVKFVRRDLGFFQPATAAELSPSTFTSFPGLSRDVWFSCDKEHVFTTSYTVLPSPEQVSCPQCTSTN